MTGRRRLTLGSLVAAAMVVTAVGAQPPARQARDQIVLESTATLPAAAFEASLRELLGRLSLTVVRPAGADPRATLARVRVVPTPGGVLVTVRRGADDAPFVQRDVPAAGSDAILVETVAYVILGAVEPLAQAPPEPPDDAAAAPLASSAPLASAPLASTAPLASAPPASLAPARREREPEAPSGHLGWSLGARFVARHLDHRWGGAGPGVSAAVALPWALRPSFALEGSRLGTMHRKIGGVAATVDTLSLRALARMEVIGSERASLGPSLGVGVDRLTLTPGAGPSESILAPATSRVQPVLTAAIAGRVRLTPWLEATAAVGLDVDTAPRRWVVLTDQTTGAFFTPAVVRPFVSVGLDLSRGPQGPEAP